MKSIHIFLIIILLVSCKDNSESDTENAANNINEKEYLQSIDKRELTESYKKYWYDGTAEISSYELSQSRYGELRDGTAVMVFVTEPFDTNNQAKADQPDKNSRPVMKLNRTSNFNTGIYPYSIMSSTFLPLDRKENALKISSTIQEWCGHTYMQFNLDRGLYVVDLYSYFQSENESFFELQAVMTENQIPIQLRINPLEMPTGDLQVIPSAEFLRLKHKETKAHHATASLREIDDGYLYSVRYTELNRMIAFKVEKDFPHKIMAWMDRYEDGGKPMVSTGTLLKTLKTAYWSQNGSEYEVLRDSLQL